MRTKQDYIKGLSRMKRNPDMAVEDQAQFRRCLGDMLCPAAGGITSVGNCHGGGSPVMEQIAITSRYDIESRRKTC